MAEELGRCLEPEGFCWLGGPGEPRVMTRHTLESAFIRSNVQLSSESATVGVILAGLGCPHFSARHAQSSPWGPPSWHRRRPPEADQAPQPGGGADVSCWLVITDHGVSLKLTPSPRHILEAVRLQIPGTKKQIGNIVRKKDFNQD